MKTLKTAFLSTLAAIGMTGGLYADERNWCGEAADADWNNSSNWKNGTSGSYVFNSSKNGCSSISTYSTVTFTNAVSVSEDVWMEYGMTFTAEDASNGLTINDSNEFKLCCDNSTFTIDGGYYSFTTMLRGTSGKTVTLDLKGGTLATKFTQHSSTTANLAVKFNGGKIKSIAESGNFFKCGTSGGTASVMVGTSGGTIDTDYNITISQAITDSSGENNVGTLTKAGSGTLMLTNSIACNLSIAEGALALTNVARNVNTTLTFAKRTALVVYADSADSTLTYTAAFADSASLSDITVVVIDPEYKKWTSSYSGTTLTLTKGSDTVAYWTGASGTDTKWSTAANWSGNTAPSSSSSEVIFPAGTHSVTLAYNNSNNNDICGAITVVGDVTFSRAESGTWAYFTAHGDIGGMGTLTLNQVGMYSGSTEKKVSCPVKVTGTSNDSNISGLFAWTFTNTFYLDGYLKSGKALTFAGPSTLADGAKIECGAAVTFSGTTTISGTVAKHKQSSNASTKSDLLFGNIVATAASSEIKYTYSDSGTTKFNGEIEVADGASLTISPASDKLSFGDGFTVKVPANTSSAPLTVTNYAFTDFSSKTVTLTGTLDQTQEYAILTAGSGSSGRATVEVDDSPANGSWRTKWVAGDGGTKTLVAYFAKPGFVLVIQ